MQQICKSYRRAWLCVLCLVALLPACKTALVQSPAVPPKFQVQLPGPPPEGPLGVDVQPVAYDLQLFLDPNQASFSGVVKISLQIEKPTQHIWMHGQDLTVSQAIAWDAQQQAHHVHYKQVTRQGVVLLTIDPPLPVGPVSLQMQYQGQYNQALSGLYRAHDREKFYVFSQFEPISARLAFPCFDEPRFKTPFDVTLVIPEAMTAVSNTTAVAESIDDQGHKSIRFGQTEPLPTYLIAVVVGTLDQVASYIPINVYRHRPLPLRGICTKGHKEEIRYAVEHAGQIVASLERYFQAPYPFEKLDLIAVPDFAAGAMENAGAITFRDWLLLMNPKQVSYSQQRSYLSVASHELAHQWFGDWTTMYWWDDLWLNESFATWMGQRTAQLLDPNGHYDVDLIQGMHAAMGQDALKFARKIHQPCTKADDVYNAFDMITYQKGGSVLNMFEHFIGYEKFAEGIRAYLQEHRFGSASTDDFLSALSQAYQKPELKEDFKTFLEQSGVPLVHADVHCGPKGAKLLLRQQVYHPIGQKAPEHDNRQWHIPVCWNSDKMTQSEQQCVMLREKQAEIDLGTKCPSWLMPNAQGVGYYRWELQPKYMHALYDAPLSMSENLSVVHNILGGLGSGAIAADIALPMLRHMAQSKDRLVAVAPLGTWGFMFQEVLDDKHRAAAKRYFKQALQAQWKPLRNLSASVSDDASIWRAQLAWFLAFVLEDAQVREDLERLQKTYWEQLHVQEQRVTPDTHGYDPQLMHLVLAAAVRTQEDLDRLIGLLEPEQNLATSERLRVLGALRQMTQQDFAQKVLALVLEPRLRSNEIMSIFRTHMADPKLRDAAWGFIQENFTALKQRLPDKDLANLAALIGYFCDEKKAGQAAAFLQPLVQDLTGAPRALALAEESVQLCAASKAVQKDAVEKFFSTPRDRKKL